MGNNRGRQPAAQPDPRRAMLGDFYLNFTRLDASLPVGKYAVLSEYHGLSLRFSLIAGVLTLC